MPNDCLPNAHDITERSILLRARRYADHIRTKPELVAAAVRRIEENLASHRACTGHLMWRQVLTLPVEDIIACMLHDGPEGRLLRSTNPFSTIIPPEDVEERRRTWRRAKQELMAEWGAAT